MRFVDTVARADYRVRFVDGPADLRVEFVTGAPHRGGQWLEVDDGEIADFTVYAAGPLEAVDFTARAVGSWPGC